MNESLMYLLQKNPPKMPLNIYVTNKTKGLEHVYVRVRGDKLQESEYFSRVQSSKSVEGSVAAAKVDVGLKVDHSVENEEKTRKVFDNLIAGGFCLLQPGKPTPFATENIGRLMYVSVHDGDKMWSVDLPVNPRDHGCVSVRGRIEGISVYPCNPKALWISRNAGDPLPPGSILAGKTDTDGDLYFGRIGGFGRMPCMVSTVDGKCGQWSFCTRKVRRATSGDLLQDTGYDLVRVKSGDIIPPNAIQTGATDTDGELYVGRAAGNIPCKVTADKGKISAFWYDDVGRYRLSAGEILLLTTDEDK